MAWNDFYMQTTGNDLNAGSTSDDTAPFTYAAGTYVRATGVFTVASGNPQTDGVTTSMWASIYTTSGATGATLVGKILARDTTTITIDVATLKIGTVAGPSESAGATTCKVGGAWASLGVVTTLFVSQTMTMNARVNIKSGTYANTTTARAFAASGTTTLPIWWRAYKTSIGDLDDGVTVARSLQDGVDLPLITFTTGQMTFSGAHQIITNLDITSQCVTSGGALNLTGGNIKALLCRVENTANNTNARACTTNTNNSCQLIGCRFKAHTGASSSLNNQVFTLVYGCHIIGGAIGFVMNAASLVSMCVIESFATTGISLGGATVAFYIFNNTIYAAATNGILITAHPTSGNVCISNNIIGGCTNGVNDNVGTNTNGFILFRNHFYSCTNNIVGLEDPSGASDSMTTASDFGVLYRLIDNDTDPFVAKGSNNFTLLKGSADHGTGFPGIFEGQTAMVGSPDIGAVSVGHQFGKLGTYGNGTISKETTITHGASAAIKFDPGSTTVNLTYSFLVPVTASTAFVLKFWHRITSSYNGTVKVTIYDTDDTTVLLNAETVSLTDDGAFHQYSATSKTPTLTGFCRVLINVLDGSTTGEVYVDDITVE